MGSLGRSANLIGKQLATQNTYSNREHIAIVVPFLLSLFGSSSFFYLKLSLALQSLLIF